MPSISPIPGPDRTQRFLYMFIFRSARRGRCRARQLRVHGSGAAHDTTRWGCEPHTLGPILQRQGFYTTGCWARTRHSRISMLESSFRRGGSPSALRLEERRVVSNLGVGELRSELPRGGGGGGSRGAGLSTNSTAPQLHSAGPPCAAGTTHDSFSQMCAYGRWHIACAAYGLGLLPVPLVSYSTSVHRLANPVS